jgi:hypothetical protein
MYAAHTTRKPGRHPRKRVLLWIVLALAAAGIAGLILEMTGVTDFHNPRRSKQYVTTPANEDRTINENTKGETADKEQGQPSSDTTEDKKPDVDQNTPLTEPTGSFVSNHRPKASDLLQSTCNATPGATCQIIFTNGSTVKSLPAQQTDKGGATYWSWTPQDINITEGSWEVTAKAVLGSQTKTATDSLKLEVSN